MEVINIIGVLVNLLLKRDPEFYGTFVTTYKRDENMIIVQCTNVIYGTMVASLIYYNKFVKKLKRNGLQLNTYDICVANSLLNDNQKTICFHVDDCKISHQDSKVNEEFIKTLYDEYESLFEDGSGKMKVIQLKLYEYLGMTLDYSIKFQFKITMMGYSNEIM